LEATSTHPETESPAIDAARADPAGTRQEADVAVLVETGLRLMRFVGAALLFPYILSHRPGPDDLSLPLDQWVSAVSICGALMLVNAMSILAERSREDRIRYISGIVGLLTDTVVVLLIVHVLGIFDENLSWFILIIPIIEAAMRFGVRLAIVSWVVLVGLTLLIGRATGQGGTLFSDNTNMLLPRLGVILIVAIPVIYLSQKLLLEIRLERQATGDATRRSQLLETVAQSSQRVSRLDAGMVEEVLDSALSLGFDVVDVCVLTVDGQWRVDACRQSDGTASLPDPDSDHSGLGDIAKTANGALFHADADDNVLGDPLKRVGLSSLMVVPLGAEGDATVALRCGKKLGSALTPTQAECVELLAGNATIALHNKKLVGELRAMQGKLHHQAYHDALTGLSNRIHFNNKLDETLADCRHRPRQFAVMFIDLDRFKPVNDSLGHDVGNELLISVARRLTSAVRESDLVARIGGDEFVVLLDPVFDSDDDIELREIADRVCRAISDPFMVANNEVVISCSVGIALSDPAIDTGSELVRRADLAMYRAKGLGKARWERYEAELDEEAVSRIRIETDMRHAIANDHIDVEFQGIVSIRSGQLIGAETLLRWNHPVRGLISPGLAIPIAEDSGLIIDLGQRVLERACTQCADWQTMFPDQPPMVAVNVSPIQLFHPRFFESLDDVISDTGVDPSGLIIEITENIVGVGDNSESALYKLKDRGLRLALDDFGQGQTSLLFLRRFPIDVLKIDKTFVQQGDRDPADRAILQSVIGLAHDLGLVVIAEGIETRSQLELLAELECDLAQGFLLSKPAPAIQATRAIERGRRSQARRSTDPAVAQ